MTFTDVFIRRPVLATVISLIILLLGLRSLGMLELRQFPEMQTTVINVTTVYPGASSDLVQGFITTPLQRAIAQARGIDFMTATSSKGVSSIDVHMQLNYNTDAAVAEIQAKVASQRNVLPAETEDPVIQSTGERGFALMYVGFLSESVPGTQITDYATRVIQPQIQALPGVSKAAVYGQQLAMRVWLDPARMRALDVSAEEIASVLRANNYLAGIGSTKGKYVSIDLDANTNLKSEAEFRRLVIRTLGDKMVRLEDIARVELGAEQYQTQVLYKGTPSVFLAVESAPGANPLEVARLVKELMPSIQAQLPKGISGGVAYDASVYISDSISEVYTTLAEAVLIVLIVIFLSLGSARAALVPAVAVPLSMVGATFIMWVLGYSINLLTLLAMVLAIGLVVDDAIIVVENIHRHIEQGESRIQAAIKGARELALPIIAMTTTLLAVYAPIGFTGGLVGTLFTEFAYTLSGAFVISGIVALTLSPVLSAHVLKPHGNQGRFEQSVESFFSWLSEFYKRRLSNALDSVPVLMLAALVILVSNYFMFVSSKSELAPAEDQSSLFFMGNGPRTATLDYNEAYGAQIQESFSQIPEYDRSWMVLGMDRGSTFGGFGMVPVSERDRSQAQVQPEVQAILSKVAGMSTVVFPRSSVPGGGGGLPIQFVLSSDRPHSEIVEVADAMIGEAMGSGRFMFLRKSVEMDLPVTRVVIDRDRAADLSLTMADIGRGLGVMLGGGYVNQFSMDGNSYKVIPQVERDFRVQADQLGSYFVRGSDGTMVPLSTVVTLEQGVEPSTRSQFQQLNSVTLEGVPKVPEGEALAYLDDLATRILPQAYVVNYSGDSRQFMQQGSVLVFTFFMSLLVIYLVLAAQFESWRDPLIILVSVPLATAGALAFITLGFSSINIYTQVGLITLIGVVAKNGILIVEFANQLQIHEGMSKREAVEQASAIRLRPILMTSAAMILAMVPLLIASGPGAVSRFDIGLTIAAGLGIGTLFTLFILPAFYLWLARDHSLHSQPEVSA